MSCCTTIPQQAKSTTKSLKELKKYFDEVLIEDKDKYNLLIIRDRANKSNYDYAVWLSLKIRKGYVDKTFHSQKTDEEIIEEVCSNIVEWVDILQNIKTATTSKQLSLFGGEEDEVVIMPKASEDEWDKKFKKLQESNKEKIIEKYGFFEVLSVDHLIHDETDWLKKLPTHDEVREMFKKAIMLGKEKPGRDYGWFWFDTPSYLYRDGALTDYELTARVSHTLRLFLVPIKRSLRVSVDLSYNVNEIPKGVDYAFYLDGERLSFSLVSIRTDEAILDTLRTFYRGVFNTELLEFIRETFRIEKAEAISDEDILKENIESYFESLLSYERDNYDFKEKIQFSKDWKQFKRDIIAFLKEKGIEHNGGGSGVSLDGFRGWKSIDRKGSITVEQNCQYRKSLGRDIELPVNDYGRYVVWDLQGDEIFKKAYELFKEKKVVKPTLFDILVA